MAVAQLVIFAGQSQANSNGTSNSQTVPAAIAGPMSDVFIWDPFGKTWLTYQAQVTSAAHLKGGKYQETSNNYFGAEAEYARRWKIDNPGVPLYMVKKAHSTTSLSQEARTANRGCWDPALRDDLYDEFLSWMADAKANLIAAGNTVNIRGMNWTQGENDAGSTVAVANAYGTNLSAFIDALRSSGAIVNTTPFVISRIQTGTWANPAPVRAAQQNVGETKAYCRWFSADSVTIDGSDTVHYGPNGVVIHGDLMYDEGMSGIEAARQYAAKMTVPPSAGRLSKIAAFFENLISNGLWSGISVLQIYAAHNEQAALVNARSAPVTALNSGMAFTADQGFTGTSSASFINTKVNPVTGDSKLAPGNVSYATYIRGNLATNGCDVGFVPTTSGKGILLYFTQATGNASFRVNTMDVNANNTFAGPSDISGLWSVSRKSVNSMTCFQKGVQAGITDTVNVDVGESSNDIFVGNRNSSNNTSGTNGTLRQYGIFIAGSGRTPAQEAALNNAVTSYMTAIEQPDTDTTAPVMTGSITVSAVTSSGFTLSVDAATDAVGVTGYEYSIDGGTTYTAIANAARTVTVTGRPASTSHAVRMRAFDAAGNRATPLSATATTTAAADTTAPVMVAPITVSSQTATGFTLAWPAATDAVGVVSYEVDNGSGSYVNVGTARTLAVTGKTASTTYNVRVRALDAAGNAATPLTATATTVGDNSTAPPTFVRSTSRTIIIGEVPGNFDQDGKFWLLTNPKRPTGSIDPNSTIDITFDWTKVLADIDAGIADIQFDILGLTGKGAYGEGAFATIFVSNATGAASITCRITTDSVPPRIEDRTVFLNVEQH